MTTIAPDGPPLSSPVRVEEMLLDAATATEWLELNTNNRTPRAARVEQYARDMALGRWRLTGEAIKFATTGRLLDGQQRLLALERSGASDVPFLVIWGLDEQTQELMDTGAARTPADALRLKGESNSPIVAAAARIGILVDNDALFFGREHLKRSSHSEVIDWVARNPDVRRAADIAANYLRNHVDLPPSLTAYAYLRMAKVDLYDADEFWHRLADLENLERGNAILALSRRLRALDRQDRRVPRRLLLALVFRAWNAWRADESVMTLPLTGRTEPTELPELL